MRDKPDGHVIRPVKSADTPVEVGERNEISEPQTVRDGGRIPDLEVPHPDILPETGSGGHRRDDGADRHDDPSVVELERQHIQESRTQVGQGHVRQVQQGQPTALGLDDHPIPGNKSGEPAVGCLDGDEVRWKESGCESTAFPGDHPERRAAGIPYPIANAGQQVERTWDLWRRVGIFHAGPDHQMISVAVIHGVAGVDAEGDPAGAWQNAPATVAVRRRDLRMEARRRQATRSGDPNKPVAIVAWADFGVHDLLQSAIVAPGSMTMSNRSAGPVTSVTRPRP